MRKLIAVLAAIGFIGTTTLSPVLAAQATPGVAKSDDFSAAKKKAKKKSQEGRTDRHHRPLGCQEEAKKKAKKAELTATDVSAAEEESQEEGQEGRTDRRHRPLGCRRRKPRRRQRRLS